MATGLTTIDHQSLSVSNATQLIPAIQAYGSMIAKGGLFGCKNAEQGQTLILMSMSEGIPITEMRRRYHIIGGSDLSMRADWMLAEFRRLGGWYQWIDQGDDGVKATLHVKYKENDQKVSYTIDMAKKAGLVKPKSGWEKNPGEMLRARCQTKAVRMVCPEVLAGFATDQELDPDAISVDSIVVEPDRAEPPADADVLSASPAEGPEDSSEVMDGEFEVKTDAPMRASGEQIATLREMFAALKLPPDTQLRAIKSTGAADMGSLSVFGAEEIISKLKPLMAKVKPESEVKTVQVAVAPCTEEQAATLKALIQGLAQAEGGVGIVQQIKAHMDKSGLAKLVELTSGEALLLIKAIETMDFAGVFEEPFVGVQKKV